jgi:hypothetical protein
MRDLFIYSKSIDEFVILNGTGSIAIKVVVEKSGFDVVNTSAKVLHGDNEFLFVKSSVMVTVGNLL